MSLKVHYDEETDVLYLARKGKEEQVIEVHPGVTVIRGFYLHKN